MLFRSARSVVEIGTGCGTSGIWLLRGMRSDAVLTSVDVEPEHQRLARKAFTEAGFPSNRYRLISGKALDVLPRLTDGAYDLVFCDADPREYPDYLEAALRLLRVGGIVAFDDVVIPPDLAGLEPAEAADIEISSPAGWGRRPGRRPAHCRTPPPRPGAAAAARRPGSPGTPACRRRRTPGRRRRRRAGAGPRGPGRR